MLIGQVIIGQFGADLYDPACEVMRWNSSITKKREFDGTITSKIKEILPTNLKVEFESEYK